MSGITGLGQNAEDIGINYMTLLVTQLRNQNPLEPMDNAEMTSQLAQISQLDRLENISSTFQKALLAVQMSEATGMIGKQVTFMSKDQGALTSGAVEGVEVSDGQVLLKVGSHLVDLGEVMSVRD